MQNQSLLPDSIDSQKRYKLLQNFSLISLSAFISATVILSVFYRQQAVYDLMVLQEENNVALTKLFSKTLWKKYGVFLTSTQTLNDQQLAKDIRISQLRRDIIAQIEGLSVTKIKIYDLQGRTVFSTELSQIGENKSKSSGFLDAKAGQVITQLEHRDSFKALETTIKDIDLLSSYIPVRVNGDIVGVFELYTDVSSFLRHIKETQGKIVLGSLVILSLLYGILFLFVQRAERLLKKQYSQLQESENRYRRQASELEQVLLELQQTQMQMLQSEKMSSLGHLVAGVAHEINNPVNFIHGNLQHIQKYAQDLLRLVQMYQHHYPKPVEEIDLEVEEMDLQFICDDLPKTLLSMKTGSDRIREIVLALRIFSRLHESEIKPVNIQEGLESTLMILQHRLKASPEREEIQVIRNYGTLPFVQCYAGLLNQVFMNILINAIDALEEDVKQVSHPQITVRTSLINDQWVEIAIADNGSGIPPEIQQRIFDPFFTTKPIGKGTGLGMSISYEIITKKHGGKLECFSTVGKGTEFVIQIPVQQKKS
ncbi:ATP-binding protein [Cronbergia sp. UHCC 0137]|uniref:sensor histidine kinase n=1 Tax=Cronbergia sp. UHCC 0137 TaxID=3110239 RepID=UPI002B20C5FA|nr:ATP-binding protein [Cronbergia sp. UHCC 0137]MEA5617710.1 ATP-binding protein [Cronbergia sp. UHCC 0137]